MEGEQWNLNLDLVLRCSVQSLVVLGLNLKYFESPGTGADLRWPEMENLFHLWSYHWFGIGPWAGWGEIVLAVGRR